MKMKHLLFIFAFLSIAGWWGPFAFLDSLSDDSAALSPVTSSSWLDQETRTITAQANNLRPEVLKLSLTAYRNARQKGLDSRQLLTIVDYTKPSTERRLWVVDMKSNKVLFNTWVAHGKNSGGVSSNSFSNDSRSLKSSLGVFLTSESYDGHNGYSLRLKGLEHGINDNAYRRTVVFHGADYANPEVAKQLGRLGRSWGCFAVGRQVIKPLVDTIKHDTLVVAYYPDKSWLKSSEFLNA
jgi:hypothetical protein